MTNTNPTNTNYQENTQPALSKIRSNKRISPFWLLPFIALCIGGLLFFQIIKEQGENIQIIFASGDGLVAGKTQVRYQGLQIGVVKKVNFTDDLKKVEVSATIYPEAKTILRENTKFWLVRPSASLAGISGLDALVSGNYITLQPGDGEHEDEFIAETEGPIAQVNEGDLLVRLIANDLGSISAGASVYFKKVPVGKIYDYRFTKDQKKVEIDLVIDKTYANLVKKDSRFWNISGIRADVGISGISVNIDSLNAVVQGAIAFDSPTDSPQAETNQEYVLYNNLHAAKRGILVDIKLPDISGLIVEQTPVFYQGLQIGTLLELHNNEHSNQQEGTLLIDPNMASLLKTGTHIVIRQRTQNLTELSDLKNLFRGPYFEILAGEGEDSTQFIVLKDSELLLKQADTLVFELKAPESYGIKEGQAIYYNGIVIGELVGQKIDIDGVSFKAAIRSQYRNLIHANTQFIAAANLDVQLDINGLRMQSGTLNSWFQGGVRVIQALQAQGKPHSQYPLYKDLDSAEHGIIGNQLKPTITLTAHQLSNIEKGSLVLFHQYEVGKVLNIQPQHDQFEVTLFIYPKFQHLITHKSRFWVEGAAQIDISGKGINIQASPIMRTLKGAISFDNSGAEKNLTLFSSELKAKANGQAITLVSQNANSLSKGMSLRYLGLNIGEIETISLDRNKNTILAKAMIDPTYMSMVAKEGSNFKLITPEISSNGVDNLDALLQPYIEVEFGKGKTKTEFNLTQTGTTKYTKGFPIILETSDATNISNGAPVMYRGVQVGAIQQIELNSIADRVLVHLIIDSKHQHLVRQNSEFWISSGYGMDVGLSGISINTGSMQQLLKGGISFSTPTNTVVQPQAKANQHFLLQIKRPNDAKNWNQGIAQ